jgi:error-prone DNA polymerase
MLGRIGPIVSAGARKETLRRRTYERPRDHTKARRYAELRAGSAFSFLEGASLPEDLVDRAVALELPAVALLDVNGVYGAPRFYKAATTAGVRALVGAEVTLTTPAAVKTEPASSSARRGPRGLVPPPPDVPYPPPPRVTLLVESRRGYKNLCRLITAGAFGKGKGETSVTWEELAAHAEGLHVLTGGFEGPFARALESRGLDGGRRVLSRLTSLFPGRVHVELQRHGVREEEHRNLAALELARQLRLPALATNGVRHARENEKELLDLFTCLRHHTHLDAAGTKLEANRERRLKSAAEMSELFSDLPGVLESAADLAARLDFTLKDLGYRFPEYPLPPGETPISYLRRVTWEGARTRFRPLSARAQAQITKELALIEKLDLAGYFLIVWDVVEFCRKENVLVQGRGSAANSAVCYALSITAVDPVKMDLLFERFLSEERGEWPDIDLDLPSGDQREKVIQHVYAKYGPHGAGMTANVITYRERSAVRECAKVLGFSQEQVDRLAKQLGAWSFGEWRDEDGTRRLEAEIAGAGFDPQDTRLRHFARLFRRIQALPRHLGQHSGGMVVAMGRLDEVVPLEPASMPGRVVVQWDKDDCADLGIVKVDLLGLGMLGAIEQMVPMIKEHEGKVVDLAHLPQNDPKVYEILNAADTIGLFQVESRAQMASLPRHGPKVFYDIVVQVAIIRPGPIVGGMVHPFFDRRRGREPVTYAHPCLEPILKRTLGVPLFQEQLLKMAMVAAGFTGGEAEELRRAMGFKRSMERMGAIEERLRKGMTERGIGELAQEQIVKSITSFALYGFPESHAASFALIAYASAWLKVHHPAAFTACLLNAWPMGFYHPATIVKDAERHGTPVLPIDVNRSGWLCTWEPRSDRGRSKAEDGGAVRMGLRYVKGLRQPAGEAIEKERKLAPFRDAADLKRRAGLRADEMERLAHSGALSHTLRFPTTRRGALWQVAELARPAGALYEELPLGKESPLPEMTAVEETLADYESTSLTTGPHLIEHLRPRLDAEGVLSTKELEACRDGDWVKAGGAVIVRQRPGTAKGFVFLSIEDETGIFQAIVRPDLFRDHRAVIVGSAGLVVEGRVQKQDGTLSIKAESFAPLVTANAEIPSHDFR